jgi:hypothetical protein
MASQINPNNIDITYPIAGQDNDTQGFRTNFTNIKNNFVVASAEISAAQAKLTTITTSPTVILPSKPPTSTAGGVKGQMYFDDKNFYYCYATDAWRRIDSFTFTDIQNIKYGDSNVAVYLASNTDATITSLRSNIQSVLANLTSFATYANTSFATSGGPSTTSLAQSINIINANVGAYETWANAALSSLSSNIVTVTSSATANTNANLNAYKAWANANVAGLSTTIANGVTTTNANLAAFRTYANATFTTTSLGLGDVAAFLTTYTGNVSAGNVLTNRLVYANGAAYSFGSTYSNANVAAYLPTYAGSLLATTVTVSGGILPSATGTLDIGSSGATFRNVYGTAIKAQYADLAENYVADDAYVAGTVVVFGGQEEITVSSISHDTRVAGIISTDPAYLMNSEAAGLPVALTGRAPCLVQGPVAKGDCLVNIATGVAGRLDETKYKPGCIIGKSLEDITNNSIQMVEIAVGRY